MSNTIVVGDTVTTKVQMHFVEAHNPETGEEIEVFIPKWEHLTVCRVDSRENTVDVSLPSGFVATLDANDIE